MPACAAQGEVPADPGERAVGDREDGRPLTVCEVALGVEGRRSEEDGAAHALPDALGHATSDSATTKAAFR